MVLSKSAAFSGRSSQSAVPYQNANFIKVIKLTLLKRSVTDSRRKSGVRNRHEIILQKLCVKKKSRQIVCIGALYQERKVRITTRTERVRSSVDKHDVLKVYLPGVYQRFKLTISRPSRGTLWYSAFAFRASETLVNVISAVPVDRPLRSYRTRHSINEPKEEKSSRMSRSSTPKSRFETNNRVEARPIVVLFWVKKWQRTFVAGWHRTTVLVVLPG